MKNARSKDGRAAGPSSTLFSSVSNRRSIAVQAVLIAIAVILTYSGSFGGAFVSDDLPNVRDNPLLRSLDWEHIKGIFSSFDDANYIPIKVLSLAIDYSLWGPAPAGFHVTNLIVHVLCALLVFFILMRLELPPLPSCLATLFWAVHPLQVESVAWISERKNVLSGLFFFAAFLLYLSYSESRSLRTYLAIAVLFALALLSKMNAIVLPAVCLAYEATFRFRLRRRDLLASLPLFAMGALVVWYNLSGNPIHGSTYHGGRALVTWWSSAVVVFRYLWNVLFPAHLLPFYDVPLHGSFFDAPVLLAFGGILLLGLAAFWAWRSHRREGFWILWFWITLLPMLNIIPFRSLMNDRYMYFALLGPVALAAFMAHSLVRTAKLRRALYVIAAAVAGLFAVLSFVRVEVFDSELALWKDWATRNLYIASDEQFVQPDYDAKVAFLRATIAREPGRAPAQNNLGAIFFEAGRTKEALAPLEAALQLDPESGPILLNLARSYARAGEFVKARSMLEDAVRAIPYDFTSHLALARICLRTPDLPCARRELEACGRIRPGAADASYWERERAYLRHLEQGRTPGR